MLYVDSGFRGWAESISEFEGTVHGCPGAGTVAISWEVQMGARPGQNVGSFEIVKGSGTGGLATLRGKGKVVATPQPDGSITSVLDANLRCAG